MAVSNLTSGGTTSSGTSATTASVSPAADALILLAITSYASVDITALTPTITGGGMTTWDLVGANTFDATASDWSKLWLFRSQQGSPTAGTIGISFGATSISRCSWSVDQFTGTTVGNNGADAIVQSDLASAGASGATSLTATLAAFASLDNAAWAAFGLQAANPTTFTAGTGFSKLGEFNTSTSFGQILTEYRVGDFDPSASWSSASVFKSGVTALEVVQGPAPSSLEPIGSSELHAGRFGPF